jgi:hypothetical protein
MGNGQMERVHGVDCVAHKDIVPYSACEASPIDHDLFPYFFESSSSNGISLLVSSLQCVESFVQVELC